VMIHFWQRNRSSVENTCTFCVQTCLGCARLWDPNLRPAARPICIMNSYDAAQGTEHYYEGNPYYYELPEWDPLGCSYFQSK
jgi:hypothetical protein